MFFDILKTMAHTLILIFLWHLIGVLGADEEKIVPVNEGDSVTLKSNITEIKKYDIKWWFGDKIIITFNTATNQITYSADETFRGRLELDQTGSLTINKTRTTDSGLYKLQMIAEEMLRKSFSVTVYAPLSSPVITSYCPSSTSVSRCLLLCSAVNVGHVTLSWFRGISVLSSISVSDLSIISLSLELDYEDNNSYSCVLNNPIRNQTTHLNAQLCQPCPDIFSLNIYHCSTAEAVIRLVVSALVGVAAAAAAAVLIYDIRSRNAEHRRKEQTK